MTKSLIDNTQAQADQGNVEPVYDILNCGPRHRFWANGKLVHNSANMQNLPSGRREGQSDLLRRSIIANDGQVIVNFDASQIEARTLAFIANQTDVLGVFASNGDVYSYMAASLYGISYETLRANRKSDDPVVAAEANKQRQFGKTVVLACLAGGNEVLCQRGWVRLLDLRDDDLLWDGEKYVPHGGVVFNGERECIDFNGVTLTPDHKVFDGIEWEEAKNANEIRCTLYAERNLPDMVSGE